MRVPQLTIHNVRLGLATNSSSSHSILLLPPDRARRIGDVAPLHDEGYGWDDFTLASAGAKRDYLATIVYENLKRLGGEDVAAQVATAWVGGTPRREGIDHQSRISLPHAWNGDGLDAAFVRDLKTLLQRDDVLILGGNDNSDGHPLLDTGSALTLPDASDAGNWVGRREPTGAWVLFNRTTGARLTVSLDANAQPVSKVSAPLLVDVKLTDRCPFDCAACYQSSTRDGQRADPAFLEATWDALAAMRVFEVALGGGEPTLDPAFLPALSALRGAGIVPNFTTRSLHWLKDDRTREAVLADAGAFAVSVDTAQDVQALAALLERHDVAAARASVQVVMGLQSLPDLEATLRAANAAKLRCTLLGYKRVGRGHAVTPQPYDGWLGVVQTLASRRELPFLGIDTTLAAESVEALRRANVPTWSYQVEEGVVSMYVDAVAQRIAPSSFVEPSTMVPTSAASLAADIQQHFATWPHEPVAPKRQRGRGW